MPLVPSAYWNMVHGNSPEEVEQDLEGLMVMRTLGRNMAWLLRCIEAGRAAGIELSAALARELETVQVPKFATDEYSCRRVPGVDSSEVR